MPSSTTSPPRWTVYDAANMKTFTAPKVKTAAHLIATMADGLPCF